MSYVFFIVNQSKAPLSRVFNDLHNEFSKWNYSVSTNKKEAGLVDILLLGESDLLNNCINDASVILVVDNYALADMINIQDANKAWKYPYPIHAIILNSDKPSFLDNPKWYFSPMCYLHPIHLNYKPLVSHLVNSLFY